MTNDRLAELVSQLSRAVAGWETAEAEVVTLTERVRELETQLKDLTDAEARAVMGYQREIARLQAAILQTPREAFASIVEGEVQELHDRCMRIAGADVSRQAEFVSPEPVQPVTNSLQTTAQAKPEPWACSECESDVSTQDRCTGCMIVGNEEPEDMTPLPDCPVHRGYPIRKESSNGVSDEQD
jgi:hypothetical protein